MQEGRAASAAVKDIFPDAEVQVVRLKSYPIKVSIYQIEDGVKTLVWSGDQVHSTDQNGSTCSAL